MPQAAQRGNPGPPSNPGPLSAPAWQTRPFNQPSGATQALQAPSGATPMPQAAQRGNPGPLSSPARQPRSSQRPTAANPALQPAWRGHGPRNYDRRWGGSPPREVPGEQLTGAARPGRNSSAPRAAVYLLVPGYVAGKGGLSPRGPIIIRMLLRHPPGWAGRPVGRIPHCLRGSPADWPTGWAHSAFPTWPPEGPATPRPQLLSQYDPFPLYAAGAWSG